MVRKIQPDWANQCKFLGTSESSNGSGFMVKDDIKNAKTEMKNDFAIQGGNAYVITGQYTDGFGTTFEYVIFRCKEK